MSTISRRRLSKHVVMRLLDGEPMSEVMTELAAYLIETGRTSEQTLIVRDVERVLADEGMVLARTVSARPLTAEAKQALQSVISSQYGDVKEVVFDETIDQSVIGGVRLDLPGVQLDKTVRTKLEKL